MPPAVIENPIINSPYIEPTRHFRFGSDGITNEVIETRRTSSYFVPIPKARSRNKQQLLFETEWTQERVEENRFIECVTLKDNTFIQMMLLTQQAHTAAGNIHLATTTPQSGELRLKPILRHFDTLGSTRYTDFDTTRPVYLTDPAKCHVSHVVADTGSWEQKMAQTLEELPEVVYYVKNQSLGFVIPYTHQGEERGYIPDFIARVDDGHGPHDLLNLIVEVSGAAKADKAAKVATARNLWIPAVNNHGGYGRWTFVEVSDPWDAGHTIRASVGSQPVEAP